MDRERSARPARGRLVVALAPETERLEAPLRGEPEHGAEREVEDAAEDAVADAVVEDRPEVGSIAAALVLPDATAADDEGLPVARAELERRPRERDVLEVAPLARDRHAEADARAELEPLEAARVELA